MAIQPPGKYTAAGTAVGTAIEPGVGTLVGAGVGWLGDNLAGGDTSATDAEARKIAEFNNAANVYNAYRPAQAGAMMNALSNRSTAYQGGENALASMYGSANAQPPSQMLSNPLFGIAGRNDYGSAATNPAIAAQVAAGAAAPVSYQTPSSAQVAPIVPPTQNPNQAMMLRLGNMPKMGGK